MNSHLSDSELTELVMGAGSETSEKHLEGCPVCRDELSRLNESIRLFRNAAIGWSVHQELKVTHTPLRRPARSIRSWAVAVVLAALIVIVGVHFKSHEIDWLGRHTGTATTSDAGHSVERQIQEDNELLSRLSGELARGVPVPLKPLQVSLVAQAGKNDN